jgi:hypothetical protein
MLEDIKFHIQMSKVNRFGHAISGGVTLTRILKEVKVTIGSHSACDIEGKTSLGTYPVVDDAGEEEKVPYEPYNLLNGYNSAMYDSSLLLDSQAPLTRGSAAHWFGVDR